MNNVVVLSVALFMVVLPLTFVAFLAGYSWAKREVEKSMRMTVRAIDTPDEHQTVVFKGNKRTVI